MFKSKTISSGTILYSDLIPELNHCFTTRATSINSEDNATTISEYLGVMRKNLVHPTQTHSSNVDFAQLGVCDYPDTDALILNNFEQAVYLRFADCTPVILYDKKSNVAAIAHAGWRGTVANIVPKTVRAMLDYSKSNIDDIYAVIGPAIGMCCYRVGDEVVNGIKSTVSDYSRLIRTSVDVVYVDLKGANAQQLAEMGVPKTNIDICPFCTACRNDLFYSYRKENGTDLRHNAVIKLRDI